MAVPAGYTIALTINTLGVISNALGVNTTLYQCPTCRATTLDPNAHDAWHTSNTAAIADAKKAGTDAASVASAAKTSADAATTTSNAAKTSADAASKTATTAASDAAAAKTSAGNASTAAGQAMTMAQQANNTAETAEATAQLAIPGADITLCPLCRATVKTADLRVHLTYHYRRAHGDPVEFPSDFDPTTQDMAKVDPPMTTNMG